MSGFDTGMAVSMARFVVTSWRQGKEAAIRELNEQEVYMPNVTSTQPRSQLSPALQRELERSSSSSVHTLEEAVALGRVEVRSKSWLRFRLRIWLKRFGLAATQMGNRL